MRVLLLNDYGTPTGGAEIQALALRDELNAQGHEAALFTSDARPGDADVLADMTTSGTTARARGLLQTANPMAAADLRDTLATFRPDVVHVSVFLTQLSPLILPVLREVPAVYYAVWYRAVCPLGTKRLPDGSACGTAWGKDCLSNGCLPLHDWVSRQGQKWLWHRWQGAFDAVVANSEVTRQHLADGGVPVDRVIGHGVADRPASGPLADRPTITFAGRLVPEKGADVLLRAFQSVVARVPTARLVMAGDGPEREPLEALARELGVHGHVEMLGHRPAPEVDRAFDGAWVHAVPSLWDEPFGMVAAEGMMRGTAVVASRNGGLQNIVRDGVTGFLVVPGDIAAWTDALVHLLTAPEAASRMGQYGRKIAWARHRVALQARRFVRVYREVAGAPAPESIPWASRAPAWAATGRHAPST